MVQNVGEIRRGTNMKRNLISFKLKLSISVRCSGHGSVRESRGHTLKDAILDEEVNRRSQSIEDNKNQLITSNLKETNRPIS